MSYKVLFSKLAEKEVKNIIINLKEFTQDLNLIQQRQAEIRNAVFSLDIFPERYPIYKTNNEIYYFRKMVTKHYIILYSIKNKTVIIKKSTNARYEYIKKSAFADFFNALLCVYVVVHRRRHLRRGYRGYALVHAHRFDPVPTLCQRRQRS